MLKATKNADYLAMINKSMVELERGGFILKTLEGIKTAAYDIRKTKDFVFC